MSNEEINHRNEAIAKFMGFEKVEIGYLGTDSETQWQKDNEEWMNKMGIEDVGEYWVNVKNDGVLWYGLCYDAFWEELMPVAQEVERHGCIVHIYLCLAGSCRITKNGKILTHTESNSPMEAVWLAVSDFCIAYLKEKEQIKN